MNLFVSYTTACCTQNTSTHHTPDTQTLQTWKITIIIITNHHITQIDRTHRTHAARRTHINTENGGGLFWVICFIWRDIHIQHTYNSSRTVVRVVIIYSHFPLLLLFLPSSTLRTNNNQDSGSSIIGKQQWNAAGFRFYEEHRQTKAGGVTSLTSSTLRYYSSCITDVAV